MTKKQLTSLVEGFVKSIQEKSGGIFDESGARALLGAQLRSLQEQIVAQALPNNSGPHVRYAESIQEAVMN
jgi:hypothetical protein